MARNGGWPPANSQLRRETLSETMLRELSPAKNHSSLEMAPSPLEPSDETSAWATPRSQLVWDPRADEAAKLCLNP